ncbi:MAG: hypothetical protein CVT73_08680 [Alphaproteobacteria bacterium HGW-Alphaproteobacteria-12]|nr:MAG: hypothetical protein CVT73_08680 [Alphaproteobacteria bacterium HGW-Alphaproteobacteria-12]
MASTQMQEPAIPSSPPGEIEFSRAAYDIFLGLDAAHRVCVGAIAALPTGGREIAPGLLSIDAVPGLRVVLSKKRELTTVLALTGAVAAAARASGRQAS